MIQQMNQAVEEHENGRRRKQKIDTLREMIFEAVNKKDKHRPITMVSEFWKVSILSGFTIAAVAGMMSFLFLWYDLKLASMITYSLALIGLGGLIFGRIGAWWHHR